MNHPPVFVGGMFKSGTSLLRAMLGRHSRIFAGLETQWLFEDWTADSDGKDRWLDRMAVMYAVPRDDLAMVCRHSAGPEGALENMMSDLTRRAGKSRWGEKTPGNIGIIPRILSFWPAARIIHITRDPRDVYASMVNNKRWTEIEEFVPRYLATVAAAREWVAAQGGAHACYFEIRYEALVRDPKREMRRVLAFVGEDFEPAAATFPGQPEDFQRVLSATGKKSPTLARLAQPLTTSRIGVWKEVVPAGDWCSIYEALRRSGAGAIVDELCVAA